MLPSICCMRTIAATRTLRSVVASLVFAIGMPFGLQLVAFGQDFHIEPADVRLDRNFEQSQLLVRTLTAAGTPDDLSEDLTSKAMYASSDAAIATVDAAGRVTAVSNGTAQIHVSVGGQTKSVPVQISGIVAEPALDFHYDVLPVLSRSGCNAGSCHASQYGKGGFTLSVMGFDPNADHAAMTKGSKGRRINQASPGDSLLLKKAVLAVPHGGGARFDAQSIPYATLATWIASGAPGPKAEPVKVSKLRVFPMSRVATPDTKQQFRVTAEYSDGRVRDVTALTRFNSTDEGVLTVSPDGIATMIGTGQAAVMVRFAEHAEIATVVVPYASEANLSDWVPNNFVDELAAKKFAELHITPSPLCDDATFLRRAFLDTIGGLPTIEEANAFLASTEPDKRAKLIDRLLGLTGDPAQDIYNDRYAALWSLKWADLIRNNSTVLGESGMWALHNWLKESFRANKPLDAFVTELITAKGSIFSNGPANYFRIANNPSDLAESTSQLFLGTRLQCAKCHHHPYERYSQADYYGFAAFFARVGTKGSSEFGVFGGESVVMVNSGGEVSHPRTGAIMKPTPLEGEPSPEAPDRRVELAKWLTSTDNAMFARNIVNRYVAYLLGRGLVDPIDDLRSTNPPSNVELMDALAADLKANHYDVKQLMRRIMNSRLYQLDSQPNEQNEDDNRFYSHYKVKRISAEPLLDCIDFATGALTKHPNLPLGTRATELPDANTTNPFLVTFGKPKRASVCECERTPDENLTQALHTLNGDVVAAKIVDPQGRVAKIVAAKKPLPEAIDELYMATLSRHATGAELSTGEQYIGTCPTPDEGLQDLLWGLINTKQFLFVH